MMILTQTSRDRFEEIDNDKDRHLDLSEFTKGAELVGVALTTEEASFEFNQCDDSGDGTILFTEFCTWCVKKHVSMEQLDH